MKNINPQKSNSLTIDICKFLGAYMVVAIHTTPWNLFGTGAFNTVYLNFIYCAVPCFFMASGYLLAGRMEWPLTAKDNLPKVAHAFFKNAQALSALVARLSAPCDIRLQALGSRRSRSGDKIYKRTRFQRRTLRFVDALVYDLGNICARDYLSSLKNKSQPLGNNRARTCVHSLRSGSRYALRHDERYLARDKLYQKAHVGDYRQRKGVPRSVLYFVRHAAHEDKNTRVGGCFDHSLRLRRVRGVQQIYRIFCYSLRRRTFRNNNIRESAVCFGQKNTQTREHDNIFHASLCLYDSRAALRTAQRKTGIFNSCPDNNGDRFCIYCNLRPHKTKKCGKMQRKSLILQKKCIFI